MTEVNLVGVHRVRAKGATYFYAWRGGPRLPGPEGSRAFLDALQEARSSRSEDASKLSGLITEWLGTDPWRKTAEEGGMSDSTKRVWRPWLDAIRDDLGKLSIKTFDRPEVRQVIKKWRGKWRDTPRHADTGKQVLSALLTYAVEEGRLKINPCFGIANLYSSNRADLIWEERHLEQFLPHVSEAIGFALRLACLCGLRRGDLLRLEWKHVGELAIELPTGKSRGKLSYLVPLYDELRALLAEIKTWQAKVHAERVVWCESKGKPIPLPPIYIVTNTRGERWPGFGASWNDAIDDVVEKITEGMSEENRLAYEWELHFHDARGTAATKFYLAGFEPEEIAEIVGWEKDKVQRIIDRYVNREKRLRDKIRRLNEAKAEKEAEAG